MVLKSGILNLLETSGPVQACNGTALPYLKFHENQSTGSWTGRHEETDSRFSQFLRKAPSEKSYPNP